MLQSKPKEGIFTSSGKRKKSILVFLHMIFWFFLAKYIYQNFFADSFSTEKISDIAGFITIKSIYFWIVLSLIPVNILLEVLFWKKITQSYFYLSYISAARDVLISSFIGNFSFHALGEWSIRILPYLKPGKKALLLWLAHRFLKTLPTFIFGIFGVGMYFYLHAQTNITYIVIGFGVFFYIVLWIYRKKIKRKARQLRLFPFGFRKIVWLSMITSTRYIVFTLQFIAVFLFFGIEGVSIIHLIGGITFMFFIKSFFGFFNLFADLGSRELAIVTFFSLFTNDLLLFIASSLLIWLTNILLPSLVGGLLYFVHFLRKTN
ncbi:MAG: hypothetical protein LAT68_00790 [Cyclobacteriaceae bacterium]|nr:hypothetical protein [Cyclobacteriaceae bacterium]MCH8514839.1 hypothetical protein [Cyclobacteriaceae bacterium]